MRPGFTPGPWRFGHYGDGARFWIGPDYDRPAVADVPRPDEANARLIAAAPEMFEALQALLNPVSGDAREAITARRDAEARARALLARIALGRTAESVLPRRAVFDRTAPSTPHRAGSRSSVPAEISG